MGWCQFALFGALPPHIRFTAEFRGKNHFEMAKSGHEERQTDDCIQKGTHKIKQPHYHKQSRASTILHVYFVDQGTNI